MILKTDIEMELYMGMQTHYQESLVMKAANIVQGLEEI